jgi:hypothetical protein
MNHLFEHLEIECQSQLRNILQFTKYLVAIGLIALAVIIVALIVLI